MHSILHGCHIFFSLWQILFLCFLEVYVSCVDFLVKIYRFADEPSIMRYIKIAATLRDKTVRDVALRCRWMTVSSLLLVSEFQFIVLK